MRVVVDTNIVFSALLKEKNIFRQTLLTQDTVSFFTCRFLIVELFKYKEKIVKASAMEEAEILTALHEILKQVKLFNEEMISEANWREAHQLCDGIDLKDTPFVALTLEIDGLLWTGDKPLREGLKSRGFSRFYQPVISI